MCSDSHWVFSTLNAPVGWFGPNVGVHPVSGNRKFGYTINLDGSYTFYTQGADRLSKGRHNLFPKRSMAGADALWFTLQNELVEFVNDNGGDATEIQAVRNRPNWDEVEDMLRSGTPITSLPCE